MPGVLQPARQCGALPFLWNRRHLLLLRCAISLLILRRYTHQSCPAESSRLIFQKLENGPADA